MEHGHAERGGPRRQSHVPPGFLGQSLTVFGCLQAPQWLDSDSCQKCEQPFFWNIKQMWDSKTLGLRQVRGRPPGARRRSPILPAVTQRLCFRSTTAGSAERPCVGNAAPNAPRTPSWASSSPCACATPALRPSEKKSEWFPPESFASLKGNCNVLSVQSHGVGHLPRGQAQHQPHGHGPVQRPDGHLWQRSHRQGRR